MRSKNTKKHHRSSSKKKGYTSPSLIHFGTIKELTSGGSAGDVEGKMMTAAKKMS